MTKKRFIFYLVCAIITTGCASSYTEKIFRGRLELSYLGAKDTLVSAIDKHIRNCAPGSCLNGITLLEECDQYGIDLIFVLSQGYIEGHYGTRGLSAKTNSVFNVGAWDGCGSRRMKKFKHPDYSVRPYINLLHIRYLVNGKTEMDLMDNYVDCRGNRYASDPNYETKLVNRYKYIKDSTEIGVLYNKYKKYKILTDRDVKI